MAITPRCTSTTPLLTTSPNWLERCPQPSQGDRITDDLDGHTRDDSAAPASRSSGRFGAVTCGEQFLGDALDVGSLDLAWEFLLPVPERRRASPALRDGARDARVGRAVPRAAREGVARVRGLAHRRLPFHDIAHLGEMALDGLDLVAPGGLQRELHSGLAHAGPARRRGRGGCGAHGRASRQPGELGEGARAGSRSITAELHEAGRL